MPRDFKKSEKHLERRNDVIPSPCSILKARGREIAGKIQNISEITNHINHKTRVYVINRIEEFLRVCFRFYTCF